MVKCKKKLWTKLAIQLEKFGKISNWFLIDKLFEPAICNVHFWSQIWNTKVFWKVSCQVLCTLLRISNLKYFFIKNNALSERLKKNSIFSKKLKVDPFLTTDHGFGRTDILKTLIMTRHFLLDIGSSGPIYKTINLNTIKMAWRRHLCQQKCNFFYFCLGYKV